MVQHQRAVLDASFTALGDVTRRGVLETLGEGDASITELARKFRMTLTGIKKHVGVLERAGLVTTRKQGRIRTCSLGRSALDTEADWIAHYRRLWSARFDALDDVVRSLESQGET